MKLWKIWQDVHSDWDTYDSAVVVAETEEQAKLVHPGNYEVWDGTDETYSSWCASKDVHAEYIGEAKEGMKDRSVVCVSFNAG